jgi:hypothetical protein
MNHIWKFGGEGYLPRHLPDSFNGEVLLAVLTVIPPEVQGVYWYDDDAATWLFWAPGAPGCTLDRLYGGSTHDYMVSVVGACEWEIPIVMAEMSIAGSKARVGEPSAIHTLWKNLSLDHIRAKVQVDMTAPSGATIQKETDSSTLAPQEEKQEDISVTYEETGQWDLDAELKGE